MQKEKNFFIINYSENDSKYIDVICNYLELEMKKIIEFFDIKDFENKIIINLFDNVNKLWNLHDKLYNTIEKYGEVPKRICGFSVDNNVYTLSLNELIKTLNHENSTVNELKKLILHESIHSIHAKKNKKTLYVTWLSEGLATTLSHQYDDIDKKFDASLEEIKNGNCYYYNYNSMFSYILKNYDKEYIRKLINNYDFLLNETERLYNETVNYYKENSSIKML